MGRIAKKTTISGALSEGTEKFANGVQVPAQLTGNVGQAELRQRAAAMGLMSQSEFRERLGFSVHDFNAWLGDGKLPAAKFTLQSGDRIFDRPAAEGCITQLRK